MFGLAVEYFPEHEGAFGVAVGDEEGEVEIGEGLEFAGEYG